jgi:hypothetical protein
LRWELKKSSPRRESMAIRFVVVGLNREVLPAEAGEAPN